MIFSGEKMQKYTYTFKRYEKKYRINRNTAEKLLDIIKENLVPDEYGKSTICSLYLDTPDFLLIRNSIDAKVYKEKLRIRSYGTPTDETDVFLEIKKKFKGVVFKRREVMTVVDAMNYIFSGKIEKAGQIMSEIDYFMKFYNYPKPSMIICYERDAYYDKENRSNRITFDTNIRYRADDLFLEHGTHGTKILPDDELIMEIKTEGTMPLWLSAALSEVKIYPSRFSKYANSYKHRREQCLIQSSPKMLHCPYF